MSVKEGVVRGFIGIPVWREENESQYRVRVAGYLYDLLYNEYNGKAHEITYPGETIEMVELESRQRFMQHHMELGWNLELSIACPAEKESILPRESPEFSVTEFGDYDTSPDIRPDHITWSRKDLKGELHRLSVYLIKYYRHPECFYDAEHNPVVGEKSGVLFAEKCPVDASIARMSSVYHRIGRTTRTFDEMLGRKNVLHSVLFTVDGTRVQLPAPRRK